MSIKNISITIKGKKYNIAVDETDEADLRKAAKQLDILIEESNLQFPRLRLQEQLLLIGLEQQDQIIGLKRQIDDLQDKLDHYNIAEGIGCVADYREAIALLNQRCDAMQRENESLRKQLEQTFSAITDLAGQKGNK